MKNSNIEIKQFIFDENILNENKLLYCGVYKDKIYKLQVNIDNIEMFRFTHSRIKVQIKFVKSHFYTKENFIFKISKKVNIKNLDFTYNLENDLIDIVSEYPTDNILEIDITSALKHELSLNKLSLCFFISILDIRCESYFCIDSNDKNAIQIKYTDSNYKNILHNKTIFRYKKNLITNAQIRYYGLSADKKETNLKTIIIRGYPQYRSGAILTQNFTKPIRAKNLLLKGKAKATSLPINKYRTFMLKAELTYKDKTSSFFYSLFSDLLREQQETAFLYDSKEKEIISANIYLCYDFNYGDAKFYDIGLHEIY